ncbi:MAG: PadR family transcriptional regulator [Burkholderiaceae bacterium]|nr:PadR family transcriptional regulator [Burkholderiaceae bacterium]
MRDIFRETFLGFIRVHLLHHAAQERIYGIEMIEELRRHGYELSPGTLYPILHAMEKAGYLASEQELEAGKVRRYYRATPEGEVVLEQLKTRIRELTVEVLRPVPRGRRSSGRPTKRNTR